MLIMKGSAAGVTGWELHARAVTHSVGDNLQLSMATMEWNSARPNAHARVSQNLKSVDLAQG